MRNPCWLLPLVAAGACGVVGAAPARDAGPDAADGGACRRSHEHFSLSVIDPRGGIAGCLRRYDGGHQPEGDLRARVVSAGPEALTAEVCAGDAGCSVFTFLTEPAVHAVVPPSALVRIRWRIVAGSFGCTTTFVVTDDAVADGGAPPDNPRVLFAAVDGHHASPLPQQVTVAPERLACSTAGGQGCGGSSTAPGDFALVFTSPVGRTTFLEMGRSADFEIPIAGGVQVVNVRNLRSYESGRCDDYWNWAWLMTAL